VWSRPSLSDVSDFGNGWRLHEATDALSPNATAARSDPEAERGQGVSRDPVLEHGAKALHGGASEPRPGHDEIIVLILCRNKLSAFTSCLRVY